MKVIDDKLLMGDSTGKLYQIDFKAHRILSEVQLTNERIRAIECHPGRNDIAVATSDNSIYILDKDLSVVQRIEGHTNSVFSVRYNPEGTQLLSVGRDANIRIWESDEAYAPITSIVGHMYTINNLEFSPDGKHFVTCSMDKSIKVWDAKTFFAFESY